jgi:lipid A 3-O-deacylase
MRMRTRIAFAFSCLALASSAAHADWRPAGVSLEAGFAQSGTYTAGAGLVWPWSWQSGSWSAQTEAMIVGISARGPVDRVSFTEVSLQPVVRYHFAGSWFGELGIGASFTDKVFVTTAKTFSTRFNFKDTIGIGTALGASGAHELGLRVSHYSNAGIKHPNPGENFLQLRYAMKF